MIIKNARTVEEFKQIRKERIQQWIDKNFVTGSVTWEMNGNNAIKITDKMGDSIVIQLNEID